MIRFLGGDIYSSIMDMIKWLSLWLNGGKLGKQQFLLGKYYKEVISGQQFMVLVGLGEVVFLSYGYGWMISDFYGLKRVEYFGVILGYFFNVVFFLEK